MIRQTSLFLALLLVSRVTAAEPDPAHILEPGKTLHDSRLGALRNLNDTDFLFQVPASKAAWEARRQDLRRQVLVAEGLWPMPDKPPLKPVIHGKIQRDGYTIEKVFFASLPGHYVCGNLYRPVGKPGRVPGVLFAHGHWNEGRMFDAGEKTAWADARQGGEKSWDSARYPLQAPCAQLARMGCVVFIYDMVGNADSKQIGHREGFLDVEAELRLQSFMGLQTWNSIRALDFLLGLPDVDPARVAITGASGGGTQTFILGAIDDRLTAAFPAVMVSTAMQGGCICENASYLRQGTGNVELAGLFAPKPLGMTGANDWTVAIEHKGFPELKALYRLYGVENLVMARCFPQFGHNYNQVSREVMYGWFNKHLRLGQTEPIEEKPFRSLSPRELSVYNADHPLPADAAHAEQLRQTMTEASNQQLARLRPHDKASLEEFRRVVGGALEVMIHDRLPAPDQVQAKLLGMEEQDGVMVQKFLLGRAGEKEEIPAVLLIPKEHSGSIVVWVHPEGKSSLFEQGKLESSARRMLRDHTAILAVDVLGTGEFPHLDRNAVDAKFAGYTYGYNRPLLANRVHDILTALGAARGLSKNRTVHLMGLGKAGPWALLARALCGDGVARTTVDANEFRFDQVKKTDDPMMLPGALKYGGLPAFAALCAPGELDVLNAKGSGLESMLRDAYRAAGAMDRLHLGEF